MCAPAMDVRPLKGLGLALALALGAAGLFAAVQARRAAGPASPPEPPAAAAAGRAAAPSVSGMATPAGPTFFVLGVWTQSADMMGVWKDRGVNTLVEVPEGHEARAWIRAADDWGLYQIRRPSPDLAADLKDRRLLAWATTDEPSDKSRGVLTYGQVREDPAAVEREAAPWRAAARAAGRYVPIWTNHVGPHIYPDWARDNALMHDYMEGPESDWLAGDAYPIEGGESFVIASNDGYASTTQGIILDRQRAWSGGKPAMAFIGTSAFAAGGPQPTAAQFNAMAWSSVIHGAVGVVYFPVQFTPSWSFDATPPEMARAIASFDRRIAALDGVLMDRARGGRTPFTLHRSAAPGAAPREGQLPYPFEAAEIPTAQGPYRIILNLAAVDQVLDRPDWGLNKAVFRPYEARIGPPARDGRPQASSENAQLGGGDE